MPFKSCAHCSASAPVACRTCSVCKQPFGTRAIRKQTRPTKSCPECRTLCPVALRVCRGCKTPFQKARVARALPVAEEPVAGVPAAGQPEQADQNQPPAPCDAAFRDAVADRWLDMLLDSVPVGDRTAIRKLLATAGRDGVGALRIAAEILTRQGIYGAATDVLHARIARMHHHFGIEEVLLPLFPLRAEHLKKGASIPAQIEKLLFSVGGV